MPDARFEEFERDFPSICFALATGVGKTRLMGAFISYLYMIGKSRNFFVLGSEPDHLREVAGRLSADQP